MAELRGHLATCGDGLKAQWDEHACALALPAAGGDVFGLSLCTGTAGLDLGLNIACPAYRVVGYVERNAYAASALVARMEDEALDHAPVWDDVETFDGARWRGCVDIITAGYPCQPFSLTGKRRGEADERHLWSLIARLIADFWRDRAMSLKTGPTMPQ